MQVENTGSSPGFLNGIRALVVDDDALVRELIATLLRRSGAEVCEVSSAQLALNALQAQLFDVLVSDLEMPELDGYDLIATVRTSAEDRVRGIAAIAVTGRCTSADRQQALALGFDGYLAKPFRADALVDAIGDVVARRVLDSRHANCSS